MAVASLRYDANKDVEETKGSVFIYDGTASRFHEWEFRTSMRWASTQMDDRSRTMSMIVEGLRGDAALIAMDIGQEDLLK